MKNNWFNRMLFGEQIKAMEDERANLQSSIERLIEAERWEVISKLAGGAANVESALQKLQEVDPQYIDLMMRRLRYTYDNETPTEQDRLTSVKECRRLQKWDVVSQTITGLWTDYAFGVSPEIVPADKVGQTVWEAFWRAPYNDAVLGTRQIQGLSTQVLTDGDIGFIFYISRLDGLAPTVRTVSTDQIRDIITLPEDPRVPVYYHVVYDTTGGPTVDFYVRDWRASENDLALVKLPDGAKIADKVKGGRGGTDVVMLFAAHRTQAGNMRGWPLMTAGAAWSRVYRDFLQDRAAVARAAASIVEVIKTQGGSRGIDAVKNYLASTLQTSSTGGFDRNPPPAAGSIWLENDALKREWQSRPTNSGDAQNDGRALLKQAGLAGRIYPHYLGEGDAMRLATATAMERPTLLAFNGYQVWWTSVWRDMARIVLGAAMQYGRMRIKSTDVTVNTDAIILAEINNVTSVLNTTQTMKQNGMMTHEEAGATERVLLRLGLQALGVKNTASLFGDKVPPEKKPEPPPPPAAQKPEEKPGEENPAKQEGEEEKPGEKTPEDAEADKTPPSEEENDRVEIGKEEQGATVGKAKK